MFPSFFTDVPDRHIAFLKLGGVAFSNGSLVSLITLALKAPARPSVAGDDNHQDFSTGRSAASDIPTPPEALLTILLSISWSFRHKGRIWMMASRRGVQFRRTHHLHRLGNLLGALN